MSTLPRLAASPRVVRLAGSPRLVGPATLGDYAALVAHLHAAAPPGSEPVRFGSPEGVAILMAPEGLGLLCYLALRRHDPDLGYAGAVRLAATLDEGDVLALTGAFFPVHLTAATPEPRADDGGGGIEAADWCRIARNVLESRPGWTYADAMDLTVDQCNHLLTGRLPEAGDAPAGRRLSFEEVCELHLSAGRERAASEAEGVDS